MKNLIPIFVIALLLSIQSNAQKTTNGGEVSTQCNCSKLEVYPYIYLDNPTSTTSNYVLRFDFNHKGLKCTPEFVGSITISQSGRTVTIPVGRLATKANTINTRQFLIPREQIGFTILTARACAITYSLQYGTTSICPAKVKKIIRPTSGEPIL